MTDLQAAKATVAAFQDALDAAGPLDVADALARYTAPDWHWRGMHPFGMLLGFDSVADAFWAPLKTAMTRIQRREDIFFAGRNQIDGFASTWVVGMGHYMGLFDAPFLGIPATGRMAFLRYAEFHRIEAGRIAETACFVDIPQLMAQAGVNPFPPQTGAHLVQPGPQTHAGRLTAPQDPASGTATLTAINHMIGTLADWDHPLPLEQELALSWHDDMIWWGPVGIGATYTIERYARQHAGPFRAAFSDRRFNGHVAKLAEGHFGGFFGWPNLTLTHAGGFMGLPGSPVPADMRVVDIYRRRGDKLIENWVFIDLLHWMAMQGVRPLERLIDLRP